MNQVQVMDKVMKKLVNFAVDTQYDDLPEDVVHEMKRFIMDICGCAAVGVSTERGKAVIGLARKLGGPPESTIIGTNNKVSCANAAFTNGDLAYALDYNAISNAAAKDPTQIVPAMLALGESVGASGKDVITATAVSFAISYVLGQRDNDSSSRTGASRSALRPGGYSQVTLASTAGAGKILKLNYKKMANAIGLAGGLCPTAVRVGRESNDRVSPGGMLKYGSGGWSDHIAITSALLADLGYLGDTDLFDYGFWRWWLGERKIEGKLNNLGKRWEGYQALPKRFPSCGQLGRLLKPFVQIIEEHDIQPDDIERIVRYGGYADHFDNNALRTPDEYPFNLPYLLACAAHRINNAHWHDPEVKQDPRIAQFMQRVEIIKGVDEDTKRPTGMTSGIRKIEVTAKGESFKEQKEGYEYLETDEDVVVKFTDNALTSIPPDKVKQAADTIFELEKMQNIAQLMELLVT